MAQTHLFAQVSENIPSLTPRLELYGYAGKLWLHRDAMQDMGQELYWGNELRVSMQTTGKKYWQKAYRYPSYGLGTYFGHFNNEIIGNPSAIFAFMDLPFVHSDKWSFSTNFGLGLTFNINEFHPINNPQNIAISTDLNVYIDFMLMGKYRLNKRWEIGGGFKFQHFSNGSIKKPNLGLNMFSGTLALMYYPFKTMDKFQSKATRPQYKKYELTTMFAYGVNRIPSSHLLYDNATFSFVASKRISFKRNIGIGLDVFYNEYVKTYFEDETHVDTYKLTSYALVASSDMIVNRFRMTTQIGVYLYKGADYSIPFYERVALRYYITEHVFANVSIKAHGFKAQFIEWGLGYSL